MAEPTFASLNPSLLARKGGAKPAMRPQHGLVNTPAPSPDHLEDLGWNDMGGSEPTVSASPAQDVSNVVNLTPQDNEVHRQQHEIAERVARPARKRKPALERGKRAAFTLRLDAERHLKLRLACTIRNRSAQQIVTDALDRLLGDMPDVASLAAHVNKN
ncbi:hypothetical protein U4960_15020 [Altererythrobacter sp. H2]|uniref:hypothetical protein n=1 Tax=Altererythrobacter sp. H2 TaxID=3108391 RepID=UPI000BC46759|nr:hypothetical protein [Altererythrobacter sp. H2]OZA92539.1 MAG: hypothetical protein B7X57_07880 [Erythrobacter sp. 34-65-8]WRK95570.1 hypothetical protein U4960_15020 [Altererythrobacter sp. H2]